MATVSSPCTLVCVIDFKTGYCFGCGRTGGEIADWAQYDENKRLDIMSGLAKRLEGVVRRPRRVTRRRAMKSAANPSGSRDQRS